MNTFLKKTAIVVSSVGLMLVAVAFTTLRGSGDSALTDRPSDPVKVVLYKSATCGCCGKWAEHMRKAGFEIEVHDMSSQALTAVKVGTGMESKFWSCHTAIVNGYVVEGHVPAEEVLRMLRDKPEIAGLAVPGMPAGSPGMEMPDHTSYKPYNVLAFQKDGMSTVYRHVDPDSAP